MHGPIKDFRALKPLRKTLKVQHEARQAAAAERVHQQKQAQHESMQFSHHVGRVFPIKSSDKIAAHQSHPAPLLKKSRLDAQSAQSDVQTILQASLSDAFSIENIRDDDAYLRYARNGIGPDILPKLHRGHWSIQQQLDLHGLRTDQARDTLAQFLQLATKRRWRCVCIIHGKGFGSINGTPVLKGKVRDWLVQIDEVIAFCQASDADGGSGAIVVLLKAQVRE
ncbi:Smr/MutS family protein [Glaciimonas sp. GG7]